MVEPIPLHRPINWDRLRPNEAKRLIRERAKIDSNVVIVSHPEERSEERTILMPDIMRILREGHVIQAPIKNNEEEWEAVIQKRMPGAAMQERRLS